MRILTCENYIFTEYPLNALRKRGFTVTPFVVHPERGTEHSSLFFKNAWVPQYLVELRFVNILDERVYEKFWETHFQKSFHPVSPKLYIDSRATDTTQYQIAFDSFDFPVMDNFLEELSHHQKEVNKLSSQYSHPNGALNFEGIYFFSMDRHLLGPQFHQASADDPYFLSLKLRKKCNFWGIFLSTPNMDEFIRWSHPDNVGTWNGKKVAHIKEGPNDWDLFCFEQQQERNQ